MTRRGALCCAALLALASLDSRPALAETPTPVYFGNGCFWGRQKDYVDKERAMGRQGGQVSAVVGYAGGGGALCPPCLHTTATGCNRLKISTIFRQAARELYVITRARGAVSMTTWGTLRS
jgi:hypothetical protein